MAEFPNPQSLCEQCGYSLHGLAPEGHCPECGLAVRDSDPAVRRIGLPHQKSRSLHALGKTWLGVAFHPTDAFRTVRVDDPLARDWALLAASSLATALAFGVTAWAMRAAPGWVALTGVAIGSAAMMYVEAMGVWFFSRRRRWRVNWRLAQRVACLAGVGWPPVGIVAGLIWGLFLQGKLELNAHWIAPLTRIVPEPRYLLGVLAYAASILWFEVLVSIGVRQVRWSNRAGED